MPTMPGSTVTTAEQLLDLRDPPWQHELWRGELRRMSPPGHWHGDVCALLGAHLTLHVRHRRLGRTYGNDTGFVLARNPDTVLGPDIAFVRTERLPPPRAPGYFEGPPDLAVEVRSPGDSSRVVAAKVQTWLDHGTRVVWVVDPAAETVVVHQQGGTPRLFCRDDELRGDAELGDFRLPLRELFER